MYNDLLQSEKEMVREIDELRMALMKANQGIRKILFIFNVCTRVSLRIFEYFLVNASPALMEFSGSVFSSILV